VPDSAEAVPMFELSAGPGRPIGKHLTLLESNGTRAVFLQSTPIHLYAADDKEAEAVCMATLSRAGLASDVDIAAGFGVHRNTVGRLVRRFEGQGLAAVVPAKRGPKGPSKVTPEVLAIIEAHAELPRKELRERIERATGVSLSLPYVSELAGAHRPTQQVLAVDIGRKGSSPAEPPASLDATAADDEDDQDTDSADDAGEVAHVTGSGVVLLADAPAFDPEPVLPREISGRHVGLALYYPALGATGLVEAARSLYRLERSVRFGVVATTVTLFFMTVVSKTTLEAAKHLRRVEFGAMAGSGFAPCVKTLRRKLKDLVDQGQAAVFGTTLARHWVDSGMVGTAYLYVDGHMKVYTGKKHLAEVWNSQRRMPLPGIHTYFVGDAEGRPLLFVSEELSANLAKAMPRLVEAIREVVGDRRFCVIFDRGGYDGKLFSWLQAEHIDFVTYQRGSVALPAASFARRQTRFEGRRRRFFIAEDTAKVGRSGPWRRIVVRSKDGHQTPILTNIGAHVGAARIAALMFARWRQENFFK